MLPINTLSVEPNSRKNILSVFGRVYDEETLVFLRTTSAVNEIISINRAKVSSGNLGTGGPRHD
jgi:hypothetical protein